MKTVYSLIMMLTVYRFTLAASSQDWEPTERLRTMQFSPENILGSAENISLVTNATDVVVEKISVAPKVKVLGWDKGHIKTEEISYIIWDERSPLNIEKGPFPVSVDMVARMKKLLTQAYIYHDNGWRLSCGWLPSYRFRFKNAEHTIEVLVFRCYDTFSVFQGGKRIGFRHANRETHKLVAELNELFADDCKTPSKPVETVQQK